MNLSSMVLAKHSVFISQTSDLDGHDVDRHQEEGHSAVREREELEERLSAAMETIRMLRREVERCHVSRSLSHLYSLSLSLSLSL